MIRIVDEPIFSMTKQQEIDLLFEFESYLDSDDDAEIFYFEDWLLHVRHWPHTTHREENP